MSLNSLLKKSHSYDQLISKLAFVAPDIDAIISSIDNTRKQIAKAIFTFWHKSPSTSPQNLRSSYSSLASTNPITSLKGTALANKFNELITSTNTIFQALSNNEDNHDALAFAGNILYPLKNSLNSQITHARQALNNIPNFIPGNLNQPKNNLPALKNWIPIDKKVQIQLNHMLSIS